MTAPARHGRGARARTGPSRRARRTAAVAAAAVAGAVIAPAATGLRVVDAAWGAAFVAVLCWFSARARRDVLVVTSAAALALAATPTARAIAATTVAVAIAHALARRSNAVVRAATGAGTACALLTGSGYGGRATQALTTTAVALLVVGAGLVELHHRRRRAVLRTALVVGVLVAACAAAGGVAGLLARGEAERGVDAFRAAQAAAAAGDVDQARAQFDLAARALDRARSLVGRWGLPGHAVPGLSQQLRAVEEAAGIAAGAAAVADRVSAAIDVDGLRLRAGRLDLDAVRAAAAPVASLVGVLADAVEELEAIDRELLVAPVRRALDEATGEARAAGVDAERLQRAVALLPDLLGGSGPRRYLVLLTTPAELRNRFGFPGAFTLLRFEDGALELEDAGALIPVRPPGGVWDVTRLTFPPRVQPYIRYGADQEFGGAVMAPHFPAAAELTMQLAAQTSLGQVDGVVVADTAALAQVIGLVGDVLLPDIGVTLTPDNAERFLNVDQYVEYPSDQEERRDVLEDVAREVGDRLETASLPGIEELARRFGPVLRSGGLALSVPESRDAAVAALLADLGVDGGFAPPAAADLVYVGHANGGGNKIDAYLHRRTTYDVAVDADGSLSATLTVELENTAPAVGLPEYVIGSSPSVAIPPGTNRTFLLLYSRHALAGLTVDGVGRPATAGADGDLFVYQLGVDLGPGATVRVEARFAGQAAAGPLAVHVVPGDLVNPEPVTVHLRDERDGTDATVEQVVQEPVTLAPSGSTGR